MSRFVMGTGQIFAIQAKDMLELLPESVCLMQLTQTENILTMDLTSFVSHYGYAALFIGSLAEGETITVLGGVAAHQGLLKFPLVVLVIALGGIIGDQVLFFIGYRYGDKVLKRFKNHTDRIEKAKALINRHPYLFVIGTRFMYGFRILGPILIGSSHLPPSLFVPLNIFGAIVWATLFTTLGYLGGSLVSPWLQLINTHLKHLFWMVVAVAAIAGIWLWFKHRRHKQKSND